MKEEPTKFATTALVLVACAAPALAQDHYYATGGSDPWGQLTNDGAMDMVFGQGGWIKGNYTNWNTQDVFDAGTDCVFLEGSDSNANELNAFVSANIGTIENWVAGGGKLIINAAPNEGGNQNWGFGGVTLNYNGGGSQFDAIDPSHPIWNGPFTPAGNNYTGNGSHHATITGGGVSPIAVGPQGNPLAELAWGGGHVVFGGMTTDNWWSPEPNAHNLRANIIDYACRIPTPGAAGLLGLAGLAAARRRR